MPPFFVIVFKIFLSHVVPLSFVTMSAGRMTAEKIVGSCFSNSICESTRSVTLLLWLVVHVAGLVGGGG